MIVLIGIISYQRLSVREYPNIDTPVVSVRTVYPGASAEIIESQVTRPLEDSLAGIEGVRTIKSVSREEVSQITVEFLLERDPDNAASDVRDRVSRVRGVLPDDVDDLVHVEPGRGGEMHGLGQALHHSGDGQLVDHLGQLPLRAASIMPWKSPITRIVTWSTGCKPCRVLPA